jgi:hypothetical protein
MRFIFHFFALHANNLNGTWCVQQNTGCDTPEQQLEHARASMSSYHNMIGIPAIRNADYTIYNMPFDDAPRYFSIFTKLGSQIFNRIFNKPSS